MDLIPAEQRAAAGKILADKLRHGETADNSGMTTGFLGTRPLLPVLTSVGENDLAVKHFQSRKFPSWGYEVEQGATTIWERWNSYTKDKGFGGMPQNAEMNSFAHYSFGAVCEWMLDQLAGIDSDGAGYQHILIRPSPPSPGSNPDARTDPLGEGALRLDPRPHHQQLAAHDGSLRVGDDDPGEHHGNGLRAGEICGRRDRGRPTAGEG